MKFYILLLVLFGVTACQPYPSHGEGWRKDGKCPPGHHRKGEC